MRRIGGCAVALAATITGVLIWGSPASAATGAPATVAEAAAPSPQPALRLRATPARDAFAPGTLVQLHLSVTNATGTACDLLTRPDGALQVLQATRDGRALAPGYGRLFPIDGTASLLRRSVAPANPDASVDLDLTARQSIDVLTPLRDGTALAARWPVGEKGSYRFTLAYEVPPAASDKACAGTSDTITVAFAVGQPRAYPWLVITIAAAALALLAGAAVVLMRRRRRRNRPADVATAVVLALVAAGVLVAIDVRPASANIVYQTDPNDKTAQAVYDSCYDSILKFDPDLISKLAGPNQTVIIFAGPYGESWSQESAGGPPNTTIFWDPHDQSPFSGEPNVNNNPCTALYHELTHALDRATSGVNDEQCGNTGVLYDEVRAVSAENRFRDFLHVPERHKYDGKSIPPTETDCFPPPKDQRRADTGMGGTCRALNGGCGSTNGDPHLVTYDGRFYDFQAAGEFVATQSSAGDLDVQVRQAAFLDSRTVAVNTAVAMRAGTTRLGFYLAPAGMAVHRDGQAITVAAGETALPGGVKLTAFHDTYAGDAYDVTWPDGSVASVARVGSYGLRLSVQLAPARRKTITGLLGDYDGDAHNDPAARGSGALGADLGYDKLYPAFADSWRVTDATSLFDYDAGQSTASFTDPHFPDRYLRASDLPADRVAPAKLACGWLGVTNADLLDACVLDLVTTGLATFALAAGDVQTQVPAGPPAVFGVDGATATATITKPGTVARLTFAGTAGTRVFVLADSATLPDQCSVLLLRAPDDTVLAGGCIIGGKGQIDGTILPKTGTYTIEVHPTGNTTGTVNLRIVSSVDQSGTATIGGPAVEVAVTQSGQVAKVTFSAHANQKVFIDVLSSTLPDQCGMPVLKAPDDITVAGGCVIGGTGFIDGTVLTATGQYTIVIDPADTGTGRLRLRIIGVTDQHGTIALGGQATAVIAQPGGIAYLAFTLTSPASVTVGASASTLADQCGMPTLRGPDDIVIAGGCIINKVGGITKTAVLQPGRYTIEVNPEQRNTGQVQLTLTTQPS